MNSIKIKITEKLKLISIMFVIVNLLFSCDKDDDGVVTTENTITSLPMKSGSKWVYDRYCITTTFDSIILDQINSVETIATEIEVWIDNDTILNGSDSVTIFKAKSNDSENITAEYKLVDSDGLKTIAYSGAGIGNVFARIASGEKNQFNLVESMKTFNELNNNTDIKFEEIPVLNIKLPLTKSSAWTYRNTTTTNAILINKKVIGSDDIILFDNTFSCFKVSWQYFNNPTLEEIKITDWISDEGLIKREINLGQFEFTDNTGEFIYYGETKEVLILKSIQL